MNNTKKTISRNIAIVTAIFIVAFSIMLITNYFQVSGSETLQSEVIENLKALNEDTDDNPQLQSQIRELDLLARKAYFISQNRLKTGVGILLAMTVVFIFSLRIYFANSKDIPEKDIDPIDDWLIKSKTRKYIVWIGSGLVAAGVLFAVISSPYLKKELKMENGEWRMENGEALNEFTEEVALNNVETSTTNSDEENDNSQLSTLNSQLPSDSIEISKVTHNGFRGNNSLGINSARNIPTSWDLASGKNILWKIPLPLEGYNSPVINGNRIFFSGADDKDKMLFCYELNTGKELWRLQAKNIPGSPAKHPETYHDIGVAVSTVATNGRQVCAIFATGDVICADMDGKQLWAKNIGVPENHYVYASSLIVYGNMLFIQYDNRNIKRVIALDVTTGAQRWAKERTERQMSWSSPIIATVNNVPQLILIGNPGITSYNLNNGEQNWRVEAMSGEPAASPAYANGIVYATTAYANTVAINAEDGSVLWKNNEFLPETASPVATKDFLFVATDYGVVATHDPQTGDVIKYMELNSYFEASPIIVEGKIYLICNNGKVFILSAKGDFSLITSFDTGEKTYATPAFTDKKIVIKTEKNIYCVQIP